MTAGQAARQRRLDQLHNSIADQCERIEHLFAEPVKVTVIVRNPAHVDGSRDVLITADTFHGIRDALAKLEKRPQP